MSNACARLSNWQGPAMMASFRALPISTDFSFTTSLGWMTGLVFMPPFYGSRRASAKRRKMVLMPGCGGDSGRTGDRREQVHRLPERTRPHPHHITRLDMGELAGLHR